MKKLFTLALTLFILSAAFSQNYRGNYNYPPQVYNGNYNNQNFGRSNYGSPKQMEIARISSVYDQRINDVLYMRMGERRRSRLINQLEAEKAYKIQSVSNRYSTYSYNNAPCVRNY